MYNLGFAETTQKFTREFSMRNVHKEASFPFAYENRVTKMHLLAYSFSRKKFQ